MLNQLLKDLKKAIAENNKKEINTIVKGLNKLGMDNMTINELLKDY